MCSLLWSTSKTHCRRARLRLWKVFSATCMALQTPISRWISMPASMRASPCFSINWATSKSKRQRIVRMTKKKTSRIATQSQRKMSAQRKRRRGILPLWLRVKKRLRNVQVVRQKCPWLSSRDQRLCSKLTLSTITSIATTRKTKTKSSTTCSKKRPRKKIERHRPTPRRQSPRIEQASRRTPPAKTQRSNLVIQSKQQLLTIRQQRKTLRRCRNWNKRRKMPISMTFSMTCCEVIHHMAHT